MSRRVLAAILVASWLALGCDALRPVVAPSADLADYRAFRVAAAPGTRLARAGRYLEAHPRGVFADEVRAAFEDEEPRFFEACQRTRAGVLRYLVDLPRGPHAKAAQASLLTFDVDLGEAELRDIASRSRADEARMETAAAQRRAVGETVLTAVAAALEDGVYGVPRSEVAPALRSVLLGRAPSTWGGLPASHEEDLFFVLPTRPVRESRLLTLEVETREDEAGLVTATAISGADLFVRWTEADQIVALDPADPGDRMEAHVHATERLLGALERRLPQAACERPGATRPGGDAVLASRACDGWEVLVTAGARPGAKDRILVSGPRARKPPVPR